MKPEGIFPHSIKFKKIPTIHVCIVKHAVKEFAENKKK